MEKRISQAFGKTIYLLGEDVNGEYVWLEGPSWDCDWYWGFGYIERYTNTKHPECSRDISSHTHWKGQIADFEEKGKYIAHPKENPLFKQTTLTDKESWELADLMKSFYSLKEVAGIFHTGSSHLTTPKIDLKHPDIENLINKEILPQVFSRIAEILTPANRDRR